MTPEESRRLAFVKYLLELAQSQTRQPEPLTSAAVLTLHDATDFFLQVAAEHLGVVAPGQRTSSLVQNLALVKQALAPAALPESGVLNRLNTARNGLKHGSVNPARQDIEGLAEAVRRALEQGVPMVFPGHTLDSISLHRTLPRGGAG